MDSKKAPTPKCESLSTCLMCTRHLGMRWLRLHEPSHAQHLDLVTIPEL